MLGLMRRKT